MRSSLDLSQHRVHATLAGQIHIHLADGHWIAATCCTITQPEAQLHATNALVVEVEALAALVNDHLSAEEKLVVPLINEFITDAEWRAITERGGSFSTRDIRFMIAFVGMALESCSADERRRFLAGMPQPQRLLVTLFAQRAVASYRARLTCTH